MEESMTRYRMLCELNRKEQFRETITAEEKAAAVSAFLNGRNDLQEVMLSFSYLLMAFTDINNEKTVNFIRQKTEWLTGLLRKGLLTGGLSNGKLSEADTYKLLGKYIIQNAVCALT